jgi:hypothetical protein
MRFGMHHSSWLDGPDPAEAFEAVKAKAQWAEHHGFVWFSVMDHMIQIPRVGAPDEPILEGWTVLAGLSLRLTGGLSGRDQGSRTIWPLVRRASRSRWASAAAARG